MRKILVAGGAGFIGSHLCERLLAENYEVICVDNLITGSEENLRTLQNNKHFSFLKHDVILPLPENISAEIIFHLASPASPNHHSAISYRALPMETMMVNTVGTLELLKFAKKHTAKFLFASTSEVYGDPLEHPQKEEYRGNVSTIGPRSAYDESKRFGETLTSYFWRQVGLDARIARIFNTYGPRMQKEDKRMIISFITSALLAEPITVFGDGSQTRSLCYINDMVEGLMRLMFMSNTSGQVVNLGSQEEYTVLEYAKIVKSLINTDSEIVFAESLPEDDPLRRRPDITKAKELLQWTPSIGLEEGIKKTIDYFKTI